MLDPQLKQRIDAAVASHEVVLFMKGTRVQPQCGFSATVIQILDDLLSDYRTFDVLSDPELRSGIKDYSSWPTVPQLYVKGEFVGGCDIVQELYGSGELHATLGLPEPERRTPTLHLTDAAAAFLAAALAKAEGQRLHLRIDAAFAPRLYLGPEEAGEAEAALPGREAIAIHLDLPSCVRADGARIDYAETAHGHELRIDNPNAPPSVKEMGVHELKALIDAGGALQLFDVRTPEEQAVAQLPGARLLDESVVAEIEALPKDTQLIFFCHHGGRSLKAAQHFLSQGFTAVCNVVGGIDAWSRQVDPSVPRY